MAEFQPQEILGSNYYNNFNPTDGTWEAVFSVGDFQNVADGGEIENGLGITDLANEYNRFVNGGDGGAKLFYGILLLVMQNQADNINADPTQSIFISENPKQFGTGSRDGQIRYSYTVNFFIDSPVQSTPDIDDI